MLLLLLAACGPDECRLTSTDVADDAVLEGLSFTAGDVIALVSGTYTFDVRNVEEEWVPATFTIERGEGSAVHHDAELIERFDGQNMFGQDSGPPPCDDEVDVPVVGTLVVASEGVDLAYEGIVFTPSILAPSTGGLEHVWLRAEMPVTTAGLPAPPEDANGVELQASFTEGVLQTLNLEWTSDVDGGNVHVIVESFVTLEGP